MINFKRTHKKDYDLNISNKSVFQPKDWRCHQTTGIEQTSQGQHEGNCRADIKGENKLNKL